MMSLKHAFYDPNCKIEMSVTFNFEGETVINGSANHRAEPLQRGEGYGCDTRPGAFVCGVYMFSSCLLDSFRVPQVLLGSHLSSPDSSHSSGTFSEVNWKL